MAKKFDLYEALKQAGFEEAKTQFGNDMLKKSFRKMTEVAWYGQQETKLDVEVWFSLDHGAVTVYYYDGWHRPFKEKTHLNDKRAFNAIAQTIANKDFQIQ